MHTSLWVPDVAVMMPATSCTGRLETVWKHQRTETATADRCFCSVQWRDAIELKYRTEAAAADAEFHQDSPHPSLHKTWRLLRRRGHPRTQRPSTQMSKTLVRGGWRQPTMTQRRHQEAGRTWPHDQADRNPAYCLPDTGLTQLSTKNSLVQLN